MPDNTDPLLNQAPPIQVPALLVKVGRTRAAGIPLPQAALGWWTMERQRGMGVKYVFAIDQQQVVEVYEVLPKELRPQQKGDHGWTSILQRRGRYGWSAGHPHEGLMQKYAGKSVRHLFPPGAAGAFRYQNC